MSSKKIKKEKQIRGRLFLANTIRNKRIKEVFSLNELDKTRLELKEIDGYIFETQNDLNGIFKNNIMIEGKLRVLKEKREKIIDWLIKLESINTK